MTQLFTAHGLGDVIKTDTVRGRTSYLVKGTGFKVWVDATKCRVATEEGGAAPEQLFTNTFSPEKYLDPETAIRSGSDAFSYEPPIHVQDNSTTLPYDPTPQFPVDMFTEQTIQPGEQEIDPEKRLSPSDSRSQSDRRPEHPWPSPDPQLFAGAYHQALDERERGFSPQGPSGGDLDPFTTAPRLRSEDEPVYPFDKVSPRGLTTHEMDPDEQYWYHDPEAGAWRNPYRHYEDMRHVKVNPRGTDRENMYGPAYMGSVIDPNLPTGSFHVAGLSDRYADIPAAREDPNDPAVAFRVNPLAFLQRHAAIHEALDAPTGELMDAVLADRRLFISAWRDVHAKAMRLRREGRVHIKQSTPEAIYATVQGDHHFYDTIIIRGNVFDLGGQSVTAWRCGCKWGQWAFKRKLTYVGRFCSHALATYHEMQHLHSRGNGGTGFRNPYTRKHTSSVVDDFKSWARDNGQLIDETSLPNFISQSDTDEDERLTKEQVEQLYDYVEGNQEETPERKFDIDYTLDPDEAYKTADALRTQPRSLTPDLQFVPEGEDEHFVDVEKDDRKTTGPGQIMHGGQHRLDEATGIVSNPYTGDERGKFEGNPLGHGHWVPGDTTPQEPDIEHFAALQRHCDDNCLPYPSELSRFLMHGDVEEFRPDTGEAAGRLDKLRDLIAEPTEDHFGDMPAYNDKIRDLVDELHDEGVGADNLVASRRFEGDGSFMGEGGGDWMDHGFAGSGYDPKEWYQSSDDPDGYIEKHERPRFQDVTNLPDGDIIKYNDSDGPVTKPREAWRQADAWSNETSSATPPAQNTAPGDMGEMSGGQPLVQDPGTEDPGLVTGRNFFGDDDADMGLDGVGNTTPSATVTNPGDMSAQTGGAGSGDYMHPQSSENIQYSQRMQQHRRKRADKPRPPSVRRLGYDTTTLPPGWGDVPESSDDDDPTSAIPGADELKKQMPKMPDLPGTEPGASPSGSPPAASATSDVAPELMAVAGTGDHGWRRCDRPPENFGYDGPSVGLSMHGGTDDSSDVVRDFHASMGAQAYARGGGGAAPASSRQAAMAAAGGALMPVGARGGREAGRNASDADIAARANEFLMRTAGRNYPPHEQAELMDEQPVGGYGARNLDGLDLRGTHYVQ
jgi:hypothetical protein